MINTDSDVTYIHIAYFIRVKLHTACGCGSVTRLVSHAMPYVPSYKVTRSLLSNDGLTPSWTADAPAARSAPLLDLDQVQV